MWSEGGEQIVRGFGDLDLLGNQSTSQPHHNLQLEVMITLNLATQEGLGVIFNVPRVFQALLSPGPGPALKAVQHFPSACKGEANPDLSESELGAVHRSARISLFGLVVVTSG